MKLGRIIIYVADTRKCAQFYVDHFNMNPLGQWSGEWAEIESDGFRIGFHQAYNESGLITTPTGSDKHPHKIVFTVADVESERERLISRGVTMGELMQFEDHGGVILCDGADVEGHRFQICNC